MSPFRQRMATPLVSSCIYQLILYSMETHIIELLIAVSIKYCFGSFREMRSTSIIVQENVMLNDYILHSITE